MERFPSLSPPDRGRFPATAPAVFITTYLQAHRLDIDMAALKDLLSKEL